MVRVDPRLYGHVSRRTLAVLRSRFHVTQVGRAAYIRAGSMRWLVGVWDRDRPPFADRLDAHHRWLIFRGDPTPLEARREAAWLAARR